VWAGGILHLPSLGQLMDVEESRCDV